jgi:purine-binding chemotaxis protein CheW
MGHHATVHGGADISSPDVQDVMAAQEIPPVPPVEFVGFMLLGEEYGVEVSEVREVIRHVEILEVPRIPPYVKGIISLRGVILPVFDMKERIGLPAAPITPGTRIIIVSFRGGPYGLLVDSVTGVRPVTMDRVEPPPPGLKMGTGFLRGVVSYPVPGAPTSLKRLLILLNLKEVLAL